MVKSAICEMLGIEYPAGPKIEGFAKLGDENKFKFVKPLIDNTKQGLTLLKAMNHLNDIDFDEIEKELKPISKENNEIFENML